MGEGVIDWLGDHAVNFVDHRKIVFESCVDDFGKLPSGKESYGFNYCIRV